MEKIKKIICMAVMICLMTCPALLYPVDSQAQEETESTQAEQQEAQEVKEISPTELDLGDYQAEMIVGEKQLLAVTILPTDATVQELTYTSSNPKTATINGMGRITALKKGTTKITVSCGKVSANFDLTVKEPESTEVAVTELDLGDCPKEITVGTSQLLSVAVIPADATNTTFTYASSNETVASVNALGRLTGNSLGSAEITVSCGKVKGSFTVTVVEDTSKEETIEVTDVEISDYEEELKVDETISLTATVLPSNATDSTVTYQSSDPEIATVNSSGEVKGIAPGQVVIYVSAGNITKQAAITVKIGTTGIQLNSDYQVMKPGETFQIKATVQPAGAATGITYTSVDPEVAGVTSSGTITAKKSGNTAIIVSNGDLQVSVTVIVNESEKTTEKENTDNSEGGMEEIEYPEEVTTEEYQVISSEMLRYFYENKKILTIKGDGYTIYMDGKDIVNYENQLETELLFQEENKGFAMVVNQGKKLCGKITIDISGKVTNEKYLYLYNTEREKYERIAAEDIKTLSIDTAGTYLLTSAKVTGLHINIIVIIAGILAVIIGTGVYIGVKKQYWFW